MLVMCVPMLLRRRHGSSDDARTQQELQELRRENERLKSRQPEQDRNGELHV